MKRQLKFIRGHTIEFALFIAIFFLLNLLVIADLNATILAVVGFLLVYLCFGKFRIPPIRLIFVQIIISIIVLFLFFYQPTSLMAILLGINIGCAFLQLRNLNIKNIDLSIMNITILAGILLSSGIEKFRGANKLNLLDIQLTIPILILIAVLIYFVGKVIFLVIQKATKWKYLPSQISIISHMFFAGLSFLVIYLFYKEVGTVVLAVPIVCGILTNIFTLFIRPKIVLHDITEIILIFIISFQIAGYMGIALAVFAYILSGAIISRQILKYDFNNLSNFAKFIPLIFIFASQEIRENKGLIEKFDITNGYQIGWIIISFLIIGWLINNLWSFKKLLVKNEIQNLYSYLGIIFIIIIYAIAIRIGKYEAAISLSVVSGTLLFAKNSYKNLKSKVNMRFLIAFSYVVGSISFLVLTTF